MAYRFLCWFFLGNNIGWGGLVRTCAIFLACFFLTISLTVGPDWILAAVIGANMLGPLALAWCLLQN